MSEVRVVVTFRVPDGSEKVVIAPFTAAPSYGDQVVVSDFDDRRWTGVVTTRVWRERPQSSLVLDLEVGLTGVLEVV